MRSGWLRDSIYWVLLFRDRFAVTKPLSQIQRSTLWPLQDADPTPSFGGFGLRYRAEDPLVRSLPFNRFGLANHGPSHSSWPSSVLDCCSLTEQALVSSPKIMMYSRLIPPRSFPTLNQSQGGIYICGAMEIGLGATVKLFRLYLEDGLAPSLDLLHMHIPPWYQFSITTTVCGKRRLMLPVRL